MANITYRDDPKWSYPNVPDGNIQKLFPSDDFDFMFDNNIGLRTNQQTFYMHDDEVEKYIKMWLKDWKAMDYYEEQCNKMYWANKDLFDKLKK